MGHIPTKLRQFLVSSFQDFLQKGRQMHRLTVRQMPPETIPAHSIAGAHVNMIYSFSV